MTTHKLLIVDDDRDFADSLADVLRIFGHRADVRYTGEAAVQAASQECYDAILMDVGLPGLNGSECLSRIMQSSPGLRCFLLTGYSAQHIAEMGIETDGIEILTKPIDPDKLVQRLNTAAGGAG